MSISKSETIKNIKYTVVTASKPGLIIASKPFTWISNLIIYMQTMSNYELLNQELMIENKFLKKEFNKLKLLEVENFRLKKPSKTSRSRLRRKGYCKNFDRWF